MFGLLANLYKFIRLKTERKVCLIVLGLDNAGKSTLLANVQGDTDKEVSPTFGFNSSNTTSKALGLGGRHCTLQLFDLGGGKSIRRVWKSYLAEVHGVVYVVDAADTTRFPESQQVLGELLQQAHLHGKPILVLANKQDLPGAASAPEAAQQLGLASLTHNAYHILACTAKTPTGQAPDPRLKDGLTWLIQAIDQAYSQLNPRVEADTAAARLEEQRKKQERDERARKAKEERLKRQAEEEAAAVAAAAKQVAAMPELMMPGLPGAVDSPKPMNVLCSVDLTQATSKASTGGATTSGPAQLKELPSQADDQVVFHDVQGTRSTLDTTPSAALLSQGQDQPAMWSIRTSKGDQAPQVPGVAGPALESRLSGRSSTAQLDPGVEPGHKTASFSKQNKVLPVGT